MDFLELTDETQTACDNLKPVLTLKRKIAPVETDTRQDDFSVTPQPTKTFPPD